jgi:hypothetical protein
MECGSSAAAFPSDAATSLSRHRKTEMSHLAEPRAVPQKPPRRILLTNAKSH